MAINLTHRPDLEDAIEQLAKRLNMTGRGRKTRVIERALDALQDKLDVQQPSPEYIRDSLAKLATDGEVFREQVYRDNPHWRTSEKPLSELLQEELYDEIGLPK